MDIFRGQQNSLHQVGVICRSEAAATQLMRLMGLEERYRGYVPIYEALCIFCGRGDGGDVELVVPSGGKLRAFNSGVGGIHHIAIAVPSLSELQHGLRQAGISLLEPEPVRGAGSFYCNFVSPIFTGGVILEFVELDPAVSA